MKQLLFGRKSPARKRPDPRSPFRLQCTRRSFVERLEDRNLLTGMPFGALPDDTAEYMLGDVYVNVVLMESDSSMAPFDVSTENWTASEIADVKSRISSGLKWWEDTLDQLQDTIQGGRHGLLTFTEDWTHADAPVHTGYEPINRTSQEFANWVYDFLGTVGFSQTGNFLTDLRAYNNAQRIAHNSNWSFTIFVVDDSHDLATDQNGPGQFAAGSAFSRSFAYAGGNAFVMPADRPADIVSHETGHMFWALDEYNTGGTAYQLSRGYYDTQNSNSSTNPAPGFSQANSIMASGAAVDAAYAAHSSSTPSLEMIGWKDSDGDGIFDVLDVPFSLDGTGDYDSGSSLFTFVGKSQVRTLPNKNPAGLQDDITINQIDRAEYSIDGGAWTTVGPAYHKYSTDLNLVIPVPVGASQIKIRTVDDRTGVMSDEYIAYLSNKPQASPQPGLSGYVFGDNNSSGTWDDSENGLAGWTVELVDALGQPLDLHKNIEPDNYSFGATLNYVAAPAVTLSAVGGDVSDPNVYARTSFSAPSAGKVFFNNSITDSQSVDTWSSARQLKIDFSSGVTEVNIKAVSSGSPSVGRLEIYNSSGVLLGRYTTGVLTSGQSEVMKLVRPQGDIAYAIAGGHAGTKVVLDSLGWGATSSITTTNAFGYYDLPELAAGVYRVAVIPKPFYARTSPPTGFQLINLPDALSGTSQVNFGFVPLLNQWRNQVNPLDVNNDTYVSAIDALASINYINSHDATIPLPPTRPVGEKFYDVNNDGFVSAIDILWVINELNRSNSQPASGEAVTVSNVSIGGGGMVSAADGEDNPNGQPLIAGTDLAARYYSQNPQQVLQAPGSTGCTCPQCTAIAEVASGRVNASSVPVSAPAVAAAKGRELQSFATVKKEATLKSRNEDGAPHIDGDLLDTIAAVAQTAATRSDRRSHL